MGESDLSFTREKRSYPFAAGIYRLSLVARRILGRDRLLRLVLDASWILHRIGYELAGQEYGEEFQNSAMAMQRSLIETHLPKGARIVDIGCGAGRWCRLLASRAEQVIGVDLNPPDLEHFRTENGQSSIDFIRADATSLPLDTEVDAVLMVHFLEHLEEPIPLLTQLHTITSKLFIEVPDFASNPLNLVRWHREAPFFSDEDHTREYTFSLLQDQLQQSGWQIVDCRQQGGALAVVAESKKGSL